MNPPPTPPLIRNATLIQKLAWTPTVIVLAVFLLKNEFSEELNVVVVICLSAWLVLSSWSALYALRAILKNEHVGRALIFLALWLFIALPTSLSFLIDHTPLEDDPLSWRVQAFAIRGGPPFYCFIGVIGLLIAWLIIRWKFSERPQLDKFKLVALLSLMFALPLCPHAFFLHMASHAALRYQEETRSRKVAAQMPGMIGDQLTLVLGYMPPIQLVDHGYYSVLNYGRLSRNGVLRLLCSSNSNLRDRGTHCIERLDIENARQLAYDIFSGKLAGNINEAAQILGKVGTPQQLKPILNTLASGVTPDQVFYREVMVGIGEAGRTEFVPELDKIARKQMVQSSYAIAAIARIAPPETATRLMEDYIVSGKSYLFAGACSQIHALDISAQLSVALFALDRLNDRLLYEFQSSVNPWGLMQTGVTHFLENRPDAWEAPPNVVKQFTGAVENSRLQRARFAESCVAAILKPILVPQPIPPTTPALPAELAHRAKIRAFAQKWLDAHPETGGAGK